jgi:hypothetical protein
LAEVVGVEEAEEEDGDEGDRDEVGFAFVGDEDEEGGDEGDAPVFAVAAVGGHAGDDGLEEVALGLMGEGLAMVGGLFLEGLGGGIVFGWR